METFDVLAIGAGLSGVDFGVRLRKACPDKSFAILEARDRMGGTWDLFRYPGVRSDSDMQSYAYGFKPWTDSETIASGDKIAAYIAQTAREHGLDRIIRPRHRVISAAWVGAQALWTLDVERDGREKIQMACRFLMFCAGYYAYESGYQPRYPGADSYKGRLVHPQNWPQDLQYAGQNVVIIGSGATAVTLAPAMAKTAAKVVMLQRTPTYLWSLPRHDPITRLLFKFLPPSPAHRLARWKSAALDFLFFRFCRAFPKLARKMFLARLRQKLGADYPVERDFSPPYDPWTQRVCVVTDDDLFNAVKSGACEIVTDAIKTFCETGVVLESGRVLNADIVVSATGLRLRPFGGVRLSCDGAPFDPGASMYYKGAMFVGLPNAAAVFGYTNSSWTLKADLICDYVCRLLLEMDRRGAAIVAPVCEDLSVKPKNWVDFSSGYFTRADGAFPKQGSKGPWRLNQNYFTDFLTLKYGPIDDGGLRFSNPA